MLGSLAISCGSPIVVVQAPAMSAPLDSACTSQPLPPRPSPSSTSIESISSIAHRQDSDRLSRPSTGDGRRSSNWQMNKSTTPATQLQRSPARPSQLPYLPVQTSILHQQHTHMATPQVQHKQPLAARTPVVYGPPVAPLAVPAAVQLMPPPPPPPPLPASHAHMPYLPAAAGHQQGAHAIRGRTASSSSSCSASTQVGAWTLACPPPPPPGKAAYHHPTQQPALAAAAAAPAGPSSYDMAPAVPPPPPRPAPPPVSAVNSAAAVSPPRYNVIQPPPPPQQPVAGALVVTNITAASAGIQQPPPPPPPASRQQALTAVQPAAATPAVPPPPMPPPPGVSSATATAAAVRSASPNSGVHEPDVYSGPLAPWMLWYKQGLLRAVHELVADPQARRSLSDLVKRYGYGEWLLQQLRERVDVFKQQLLQAVSAGQHASSDAAVDGLFEFEELISQAQAAGPPGAPLSVPGRPGHARTSSSSSTYTTGVMHLQNSAGNRYLPAATSNGHHYSNSSVSMSPAAARGEQGWGLATSSSKHNGTQQAAYVDVRSASDAAEARQQLACIICLEAPRSVLLLPCKHLVLCSKCAAELQDTARSSREWRSVVRAQPVCPVCREAVTSHIEGVYL